MIHVWTGQLREAVIVQGVEAGMGVGVRGSIRPVFGGPSPDKAC